MAHTKLAPGLVPVQGFVLFVLSTFFKRLLPTHGNPCLCLSKTRLPFEDGMAHCEGHSKKEKKNARSTTMNEYFLAVVLTSLLAETSSGSVFDE